MAWYLRTHRQATRRARGPPHGGATPPGHCSWRSPMCCSYTATCRCATCCMHDCKRNLAKPECLRRSAFSSGERVAARTHCRYTGVEIHRRQLASSCMQTYHLCPHESGNTMRVSISPPRSTFGEVLQVMQQRMAARLPLARHAPMPSRMQAPAHKRNTMASSHGTEECHAPLFLLFPCCNKQRHTIGWVGQAQPLVIERPQPDMSACGQSAMASWEPLKTCR